MIIFQTLKTLPYMDRMEIVQKVLERSKRIYVTNVKASQSRREYFNPCLVYRTFPHTRSLSLSLSLFHSFSLMHFVYAFSHSLQLYFIHNNINIVVASDQIFCCSQQENEKVKNFMQCNCLSIFIPIQNRKHICLTQKMQREFFTCDVIV